MKTIFALLMGFSLAGTAYGNGCCVITYEAAKDHEEWTDYDDMGNSGQCTQFETQHNKKNKQKVTVEWKEESCANFRKLDG